MLEEILGIHNMKQACEQATANNGAGGVDGFKWLENYISNNLSAAHRKGLLSVYLQKNRAQTGGLIAIFIKLSGVQAAFISNPKE